MMHLPAWRFSDLVAVAIIAIVALLLLSFKGEEQKLLLDITTPNEGNVQVFFDLGGGFDERHSTTIRAPQGSNTLEFHLPAGGSLQHLRIDPSPSQAPFAVTNARIFGQSGETTFAITNVPIANEARVTVTQDRLELNFDLSASDPYAVIDLAAPIELKAPSPRIVVAIMALLLGGAVTALVYREFPARVPVYLALPVVVLAFAMASITPIEMSHPDEQLHGADASYFQTALLPPALDGDDLLHSYSASPYGVSYLFEWNVVYLLAGKVASVLAPFGVEAGYAFRLLNVALLAAVFLICVRHQDPLFLLPLLVIPQAWYVFSYFNGDALPLALSFIAVGLATARANGVERFLKGTSGINSQVAIFAVVIGLLLISKRNYYVVVAFIVLWQTISVFRLPLLPLIGVLTILGSVMLVAAGGPHLLALLSPLAIAALVAIAFVPAGAALLFVFNCVRGRYGPTGSLMRAIAVYGTAVLIASPWIISDISKNGFGEEKSLVAQTIMETYASAPFKPSTLTERPEESYAGLRLADKGVGVLEMAVAPYQWVGSTSRSFYAAFGYMRFFTHHLWYYLFPATLLAIISIGVYSLSRSQEDWGKYVLAGSACSVLLVLASYLHSWTYDFQPQGRYVLGILPIMAAFAPVLASERGLRRISNTVGVAGFAIAAVIFVNVGLANTAQ